MRIQADTNNQSENPPHKLMLRYPDNGDTEIPGMEQEIDRFPSLPRTPMLLP